MENGAAVDRLREAGERWTDGEALLAACRENTAKPVREAVRLACSRVDARGLGELADRQALARSTAAGYAVGRTLLGTTATSSTDVYDEATTLVRAVAGYDLEALVAAAGSGAAIVRESITAPSRRSRRKGRRKAFAIGLGLALAESDV